MSQSSTITDFYKNQTVFITGATGFLGKVLLEKILRVCDVRKLYLLVRPKKGQSVQERFDNFFNFPCFRNLDTGEFKEKLVFINGNCELPNLGLSDESIEVLINETNIVIHAAANVKFDLPLRTAATINVGSTVEILNLAKKMSQLKAFVYISTAFSNAPNQVIDEICYPPPMTPKQLFSLLEGIPDDGVLDIITPKILKGWPNTYTFTKSIAEYLLSQEGKGLPICISRPTMVVSTLQEPMPGWIDNFYGPIGIVVATGLGVLRSFYGKLDATTHLLPCDYACNKILAAAWKTATEKPEDVTFYNTFATEKNSITWEKFVDLVESYRWIYPLEKSVWYCSFKFRENFIWHKICVFFQHTLVAYLADFILICIGRKTLAVTNYARLDKLMELTSYFAERDWIFISNNTHELWEQMSPKDKELFMFDMNEIDWPGYCGDSIKGGKIYLLKESLENIPKAKKKLRILMIAHYTILALFYYFIYVLIKTILF